MAKGKLTVRAIEALKPGKYADGGGLNIRVQKSLSKQWAFIWMKDGRSREMGMGGYPQVTLAEARARAAEARRLIEAGMDPIAIRDAERRARAAPSFAVFARTFVNEIEGGFANAKHRQQWRNTLETYATPIASKPLNTIQPADVLACLQPIWLTKPETARRLRQRIERVLDAAKAKGLREGDNPARWKGNLDHLLPKTPTTKAHHAALPWRDLPAFMTELRTQDAMGARCLRWTILTACRSGEARGARWDEIDDDNALWIIPAQRMKASRPRRVPLTVSMLDTLTALKPMQAEPSSLIFPGKKDRTRPLSDMTLTAVLRRMDRGDLTAHGFRSTFRDWRGDATDTPREIAEAALAHAVGDEVEQAYRRGDALEKRRTLMAKWDAFCSGGDTP